VQIRRAENRDAEAIATVLLASFEEYESLYTPSGFAATTPPAEVIRNRWNEGPVRVAIQGEEVVGTVAAVLRGAACGAPNTQAYLRKAY